MVGRAVMLGAHCVSRQALLDQGTGVAAALDEIDVAEGDAIALPAGCAARGLAGVSGRILRADSGICTRQCAVHQDGRLCLKK